MRGPSSNSVLKLVWEYPVYTPPKDDYSGPTAATKMRAALPEADALAYLAGKDPRPLLVVRECVNCNGTDDALLNRGNEDNERTFLLSRWFHCVKLPQDVVQPDHPFHSLFASEDPEHMFFAAHDGAGRVPLESERSRAELWDAMLAVLATQYAGDPEKALRGVIGALDELDRTDVEIGNLEQRYEDLLEKEGVDGKRVVKLRAEIVALRAKMSEQVAEFERRAQLPLKPGAPGKG